MYIRYRLFCLLLPLCFLIHSCQKYPDGPFLSVLGKKGRVANDWRAILLARNDQNVLDDYISYELSFTKSGQFTWATQAADTSGNHTFSGTWDLANAKEAIQLNYMEFDTLQSAEVERLLFLNIRKLKNKELWLNYSWMGDEFYVQLEPR